MTAPITRELETTVTFGVSARLVAILGQHLIRDNSVGLLELIKNGYDADADRVSVEMYDLNRPEHTRIIVTDNGVGMTREVLTGPFLTVAHGHKEVAKGQEMRSARGRIPLGEKGVGRFAVHKLGRHLLLVTRPLGQATEFVLAVDWDAFDAAPGLLESVSLHLTERAPQVFTERNGHGTRLEMTGAREKWKPGDVAKLQASLMRLTDPYFGVHDFQVWLACPQYPQFEDLTSTNMMEKYQFRLDCRVDEEGIASYEYHWRDEKLEEHLLADATDLWQERVERRPTCGPFSMQISAWLMDQKQLHALGVRRDQIAILSGISIYRDGFRVLPYGDSGDDWLGLDARRINNPAERFGNRQVIGQIGIDQVQNRQLMDKTNREGLQENQAYEDLKKMALAAMALLEQLSQGERQRRHRGGSETHQRLSDEIQRLDLTMQEITVRTDVEITRTPSALETIAGAQTGDQVLVDREQWEELQKVIASVRESAAQVLEHQAEERDAYLHLIGTGLVAERFIHEAERQLHRAMECVTALRAEDLPTKRAQTAAKELDLFVNSLRGELRLLGQLRHIRRSQRAGEVSVRRLTELLLIARDAELSALDVDVEPWLDDDLTTYMSEAAAAQAIGNVLDNALYWLGQARPTEGRRLRVKLDAAAHTLTIWNNGPAVDRVVRERIFLRPFVTSKPDGHGLGMYLSAEIMNRAGGSLRLLDDAVGAGFVVEFRTVPAAAVVERDESQPQA